MIQAKHSSQLTSLTTTSARETLNLSAFLANCGTCQTIIQCELKIVRAILSINPVSIYSPEIRQQDSQLHFRLKYLGKVSHHDCYLSTAKELRFAIPCQNVPRKK